MAGPFPQDKDRNCYLLIAMDPFSKWVEINAPCPHYIVGGRPSSYTMTWLPVGASRTTSRPTMALSCAGSFAQLCKGLGIIHLHITIGNSKANRQVEWMIRMLKDCIQRGLTKAPATFWTNHLALVLLLLCMTASRMMGVMPYLLETSQQPLLPSMAIPGLPSLPDQPTPDEEETYLTKVSHIVEWLQGLGGTRIKEGERRIRQLTRWDEGAKVNPMALFYFQPG